MRLAAVADEGPAGPFQKALGICDRPIGGQGEGSGPVGQAPEEGEIVGRVAVDRVTEVDDPDQPVGVGREQQVALAEIAVDHGGAPPVNLYVAFVGGVQPPDEARIEGFHKLRPPPFAIAASVGGGPTLMRRDELGWTVFDIWTGWPVFTEGAEQVGLDIEDADDLVDLLNLMNERRSPIP